MAEYHKNAEEKPQKRHVKRTKRFVKKRKRRKQFGGNSRHGFLFALLLFVSLCFGGWRVWRSDAVQMRFVYMWPYQNEIVTYANKNNREPVLVAAVIQNESGC